jgi:hypothetical protein
MWSSAVTFTKGDSRGKVIILGGALDMFVGLNEERIKKKIEYTRRIAYDAAPIKKREDRWGV